MPIRMVEVASSLTVVSGFGRASGAGFGLHFRRLTCSTYCVASNFREVLAYDMYRTVP